jgi:hypothetical protein
MTLTKKETVIIQMVSRPWWPKAMLFSILALISCGLVSLGITIMLCVKLFQMVNTNLQPASMADFSRAWVGLLIAGMALNSFFYVWYLRKYGLLIGKLNGEKKDNLQN